jgi:general L-amino acid transport system substrate-binding protein
MPPCFRRRSAVNLSVRRCLAALVCAFCAAHTGDRQARAGTLDRIHAANLVHCGSAARPGLASPDDRGGWQGLVIDICRAVAAAAGQPSGRGPVPRIVFHPYVGAQDYDAARSGADELAFLSTSEMQGNRLLNSLRVGAPVFYLSRALMVGPANPAHDAKQLGSQHVCVPAGTETERDTQAYFATHHLALREFSFQEADEMLDAYVAGRCEAIAGDTLYLAQLRRLARETGTDFRLLPDVLSADPLLVATPVDDVPWAAVVAWAVETLMRADSRDPTELESARQSAAQVGSIPRLDGGSQERLLQPAGTYRDMFRRHLGPGSPLDLQPGPNTTPTRGGLLSPLAAE